MATTYYNANQNLKAVGVPVEFTEEQIQEYIKCKKNPIYFIENYCKIVSLDDGVVDDIFFRFEMARVVVTVVEELSFVLFLNVDSRAFLFKPILDDEVSHVCVGVEVEFGS